MKKGYKKTILNDLTMSEILKEDIVHRQLLRLYERRVS